MTSCVKRYYLVRWVINMNLTENSSLNAEWGWCGCIWDIVGQEATKLTVSYAVRRCIKPNLLCKRHTIATVTGHHRPPDCTLHDVETAWNEERSIRYVSPRLRGIIITLQPQLSIGVLIGLMQRCLACPQKNTFPRFNSRPLIFYRRLLKWNRP